MKFKISSLEGLSKMKDSLTWGIYKYPQLGIGNWLAYSGYDMSGHFEVIGDFEFPYFKVDSCGKYVLIYMWWKKPHDGRWVAGKQPKFDRIYREETNDGGKSFVVIRIGDMIKFLRQEYGIW